MDLFERELSLESEMIGLGDQRMWKSVLEARERDEESRTNYARRLMACGLESFKIAVEEFIADGKTRPGRKHSLVPVLEQFDSPAVPAFIALQIAMDSITKKKSLSRTAVLVGKALEDELRFKQFELKNKALWETLRKDLQKREHNKNRRRAILIHEMKKDARNRKSMRWTSWTDAECLVIGVRLLEILEKSTGLIQTYRAKDGKKITDMIQATPDTLAWIKDHMDQAGVLAPMYLPTLIPPKRWKHPIGGGYHLDTLKPLRLVKVYGKSGAEYLRFLQANNDSLRHVYAAINAVQATPWKVNKPVLAVMKEAWGSMLEIGKVPMKLTDTAEELEARMPLPVKPADIETNKDARIQYCREATKVYTKRAQQISKTLQQERLMWLAEKFEGEERIYFPMQLDFRGRMYAVPSFLNPQGADPAKALLTFARSKPLGKGGWRWLHIHIANMWGEDKISFDEREKWTADNLDWIMACAKSPFEHREWMKADKGDKAWQFLAGAIELTAAVESGQYENYWSSLPISVDGSCNGLQHFSAMLLDEAGAEAVNLKPNEKPQDIYQMVADRVKIRLEADAKQGNDMAAKWLAWGFDRKATKRAVMIVPYSGTLFAAKEYTLDYVQERKDCPFDDEYMPAFYFAQHVWAAIAEVITSAKKVMNWLRLTARAITAHGSTIDWVTPVGFPVKQNYLDLTLYQVDTRLGDGLRYQPALVKETGKLDRRAQEQGISPNFVHSLDAACLMLTVNRGVEEGIYNFAMVHDSYGALAADMDTLFVGLRQAFVDIYQQDVMQDFFKSATSTLTEEERSKIPTAPPKGTFVLESVKDSKYFFA